MSGMDSFLANLKAQAMEDGPHQPALNVIVRIDKGLPVDKLGRVEDTCVWCHGDTTLIVSIAKFKAWREGAHIQNVWPDTDAGIREMLITGTHPGCFDDMYKDEDEDDDA